MNSARWTSQDTELLLNPRLPASEQKYLQELFAGVPSLPAHLWVATSGSSGPAKLVALAKTAVLASARAVNHHLRATAADVWALALPEFHVGGLGVGARSHLVGARSVSLAAWSAPAFVDLCQSEGVTLSALVPAQVSDLVSLDLRAPASLRAVVIGGGALSAELYRRARVLGWPLLPSYGLTECASQVATAALESLTEPPGELPRLQLLDHVQATRVGETRWALRSPALLTGYAQKIADQVQFVDPKVEGAFVPEDRLQIENAGPRYFVRPLGRDADFIKVGGESVSLARLEQIWNGLALGEAEHSALVAVADARLGHTVQLAVTAHLSPAELDRRLAEFNAQVAPFERIRAWRRVDLIPRSALGKVQRAELLKKF